MLPRGYNRPTKRKLIPHLFSNILQVVAAADRPLTQPEIVEAVAERLDRCDEELKRQITVGLNDALIYGYLRIKNHRYSVVPDRLDPSERPATASPVPAKTFGPGTARPQRLQRSVSDRLDTSSCSSSDSAEWDDQRLPERRSSAAIVPQSGPEPPSEESLAYPAYPAAEVPVETAPEAISRHRLRSSQSRRPSELE